MAGMAIYSEAGSGKSTKVLTPLIMHGSANIFALDAKGELMAVTLDGIAHLGVRVYVINPYQVFGVLGNCHIPAGSMFVS